MCKEGKIAAECECVPGRQMVEVGCEWAFDLSSQVSPVDSSCYDTHRLVATDPPKMVPQRSSQLSCPVFSLFSPKAVINEGEMKTIALPVCRPVVVLPTWQ